MIGKYIFLAKGFEDIEAIATLDILRRSNIEVYTVSVTGEKIVYSSHGVGVEADMTFEEFLEEVDAEKTTADSLMVFPGGMPGTGTLASHGRLMSIAKNHFAAGGLVACICAAPGFVAPLLPGFRGRKFTCFTGCEDLAIEKGGRYIPLHVITDGNLITAKGPGTAIEFGLAIIRYLKGEAEECVLRKSLMLL